MAKRRAPSPGQGSVPAKRGPTKLVNTRADAASTESQDMLALGDLLKTPTTDDKEVEHFRYKITADQKKLKIFLHQQSRQAEEAEARRRNEIASTILDALKTPQGTARTSITTFAGTRIATNAAYAPVNEVITASEALLDEYERLDKTIIDMGHEQSEPPGDAWHQELQEAEGQLQMGARVAVRNVKKVLGAVVDSDGDGEHMDLKKGDGEENTAGDGPALNYELQKSLRYAERGVKRMVKGLPEDDNM